MPNVERHRGFTLLELILVISILAIVAALGRDFYYNYQQGAALDGAAKELVVNLRSARDRAMNGEQDRSWGIRLVNGANDYYEMISTSGVSTSTVATTSLPVGVFFAQPGAGANLEVVFSKIGGTTTATAILLTSSIGSSTVNVNGSGNIY